MEETGSEVVSMRFDEEALEVLVGIARTDAGRSDLASKGIVRSLLDAFPEFARDSSLLLLCLKLLRNLCAGEIRNQDAFVECNGVDVVLGAMRSWMVSREVDVGGVRTALQVLANVSLAGDRHRMVLWTRLFPEEFLSLARVRRREILDPLCMIMYVCSVGDVPSDADLSGQQELLAVAELVRTASVVGFQEQWFGWLMSKVCLDRQCLPALFAKLVNAGISDDDAVADGTCDGFSSDQAYLVRILSEILTKQLTEMPVSGELAMFILQLFQRALSQVDFSSRNLSSLPTGSLATDVLGYTLLILRDICAQDSAAGSGEGSEHAVQTLLSHGLLDALLSILGELESPAIIQKSIDGTKDREVGSGGELKLCPYRGFRRDIVAVIGNCAYGRKIVQDEVRQKNGLLLMLQQCVSDESNPFLREWGIWAMKNLLEGNEENENAVRDLEFQGSATSPQIASLGLKVEVDPKSGKAKLVNDP
ncbi:hypothetical protein MLD38_013558 [Melastoma candidum]|uniref:Uncharacterized protein n=1 Tax=Melastoma candidum TaxID=119954 RepID=A0ACB9RD34_9MYRT|nr:hypothetical protein MLD38_013558 [Melastoma candidum]